MAMIAAALIWAIPALLALAALTISECTTDRARTLLSGTALLWIATLTLIVLRS